MKILLYPIICVFLLVLYVRYLERTTLFFPSKPFNSTPENAGLAFEDIYFETEDKIKLHGWFIKADVNKGTVLFFHGNAGNIGDRIGKIKLFHSVGLNVFIVDYRGYGKSEGKPTEQGLYQDALAAYDYLATRSDIDKEKIVGYGASLGGVPVVDLALHRSLAAIIVDSSFSNAEDMAKKYFPYIPSFLVGLKLDSLSKVPNIKIPKLFIHSPDDQTVPYELGRKLFDAAAEPKQFLQISGGHNDDYFSNNSEFIEPFTDFLKTLGLI